MVAYLFRDWIWVDRTVRTCPWVDDCRTCTFDIPRMVHRVLRTPRLSFQQVCPQQDLSWRLQLVARRVVCSVMVVVPVTSPSLYYLNNIRWTHTVDPWKCPDKIPRSFPPAELYRRTIKFFTTYQGKLSPKKNENEYEPLGSDLLSTSSANLSHSSCNW